MRASLGCYACKTCGSQFEAPILGDFAYGEFVLHSANGRSAYLDAISDAAFGELGIFLDRQIGKSRLNDKDRSDLFQKMYGLVACDPDEAGAAFQIGHPWCQACGSREMASWNIIRPLRMSGDIPAVTHRKWDSLDAEEKANAVAGWLRLDPRYSAA
jgi:hypothetical protein